MLQQLLTKMCVAQPHPLWWSGKLKKFSRNGLDYLLLDAKSKRTMQKCSTIFNKNWKTKNGRGLVTPSHKICGDLVSSKNFLELVLIIPYTRCKNSHIFSCRNVKTKNGRGLVSPLWVDDKDWQNAWKYFGDG